MRRAVITLQEYVGSHPKACTALDTMLKPVVEILMADPIATMRRVLGQPYKDYTIWRRNPTHFGLWIHYARTVSHKEAMAYAAVPGAVVCTTQLYHALHQEKLLSHEWVDLQTLWDMQENSCTF